jgi:hypothetical protein
MAVLRLEFLPVVAGFLPKTVFQENKAEATDI